MPSDPKVVTYVDQHTGATRESSTRLGFPYVPLASSAARPASAPKASAKRRARATKPAAEPKA